MEKYITIKEKNVSKELYDMGEIYSDYNECGERLNYLNPESNIKFDENIKFFKIENNRYKISKIQINVEFQYCELGEAVQLFNDNIEQEFFFLSYGSTNLNEKDLLSISKFLQKLNTGELR